MQEIYIELTLSKYETPVSYREAALICSSYNTNLQNRKLSTWPLIVLGQSEPMESVHCRQINFARVHSKNGIKLWIYRVSFFFRKFIRYLMHVTPCRRERRESLAAWGLSSTGRGGIRSPVVVQTLSYSMKTTSAFTAYPRRSVFQ